MPIDFDAMGSTPIPPTNTAAISAAEAEEERYYVSDKKKRGHKRDQFSKDVVHYGSVILIILSAICLALGIITWAAHQVLPASYLWLDDKHIDKLGDSGKILISGTIGALGSRFLARNIEPW